MQEILIVNAFLRLVPESLSEIAEVASRLVE